MTADEDVLRRQLAYADDHLPGLDPDAVVVQARRHRRRRRLTAAAATLVLVSGAGGAALALRPAQQDTLRPGRAPAPTAAPSPSTGAAATDGDAVTACRDRIDSRLPGGTDGWRMTVRTERTGAWVVNIWTDTPVGAAQPVGVPDYVCTVVPAGQGGTSARVAAVRPDIGTPVVLAPGTRPGGTVLPSQVAQLEGAGTAFSPPVLRLAAGAALEQGAAVFPLLPVLSPCVERVTLQLDVQGVAGDPASAQVAVYGSAAYRSLAEGHLPGDPAEAGLLWDTRPRGLSAAGLAPGAVGVDVTDLYRAWVDDRFSRTDRSLPAGAPFAVVLRPPDASGPAWSAQVGGQPRLEWTARDGCR